MTSISNNVYIDKLDDIVNKYNNIYHNTIKMKPVNVKSSMYIHSRKEINNKDPKFKIFIPDLFIKCNQIFKMHSSTRL